VQGECKKRKYFPGCEGGIRKVRFKKSMKRRGKGLE